MKRWICLVCALMILGAFTAGVSEDARTVWYDDEAARAGVTNDSWMSLESDTDIYLNEGREFHIWTQYYGTDAITQEVSRIEVLLNGEQCEVYDNFFMDCHIPYKTWKPMLADGQYVTLTLKFDTVYGPSEQSVQLIYNPDVPPLCEEHTWQVNRQKEIYAPCVTDSTSHYLKEAYYDRECTVCGLVQRNEHQVYKEPHAGNEFNEPSSPVTEKHQCGEDGICVAEGCGAPAMLTGRISGLGAVPGSSYFRDYDEDGMLTKEYYVENPGGDASVFERIRNYENGIIMDEKREYWSAGHERMTSREEEIFHGSFVYDSHTVNDFNYKLVWEEETGYRVMINSFFYPNIYDMKERFGDGDVLLQTDYHRRGMDKLSEEIRTNELFDMDRYDKLDEDGKRRTLEEITKILEEDIFETDYGELYINMDNNPTFEDGMTIGGEARYDGRSDNVYLRAGGHPLDVLVSKLAHEIRHSAQYDIVNSDDETLRKKYDLYDREGGDDYVKSLEGCFAQYWEDNYDRLTDDQKKVMNGMAADIADQLNIPDEYRDAFCEELIRRDLITYQYRTQASEADAWIVEGEVKQMMENR